MKKYCGHIKIKYRIEFEAMADELTYLTILVSRSPHNANKPTQSTHRYFYQNIKSLPN